MTIREQLNKLYEDEPHHKIKLKYSLSCKLQDKTVEEQLRHDELLKIKEKNSIIMRGGSVIHSVKKVKVKKKNKYGF